MFAIKKSITIKYAIVWVVGHGEIVEIYTNHLVGTRSYYLLGNLRMLTKILHD